MNGVLKDKSWVLIIPFFLHPTPCYLILQWHSPCAKKTKKACLLGCTQQIVTKLKLLLKEGKKEPMHVFCSHSKPGIFTPHHLSSIFFTFQIHKASQPTHPPAWFSVRVTNVEQNESTAHMLHSNPPKPRSPMLFQCSNQSRSQISPPAAPTADPAAQNPQLTTTTRGKGGKGKLYQIGVERAAVRAGTSSRRILRW